MHWRYHSFNSFWPSDAIWWHISGSTMAPGGTNPLPESMVTNHQRGFVAFTWWQFHRKCSTYLLLIWLISNQRLHQHLPQANELNWARLRLPAPTMLGSHVDVDTTDVQHHSASLSITCCGSLGSRLSNERDGWCLLVISVGWSTLCTEVVSQPFLDEPTSKVKVKQWCE